MKKLVVCCIVLLLCLVSVASAITFSDLEGYGSNYVEAITNLSERKVINGYPDGTYKPDNNVTRAEVIKIIVSAFDIKLKEGSNVSFAFDDVKGKWCEEFVKIGASNGLLKGYEDGTFRPDNNVTYGELSAIVCRVLGFDEVSKDSSDWAKLYMDYLEERGIFDNISTNDFISINKARRDNVALVAYNAVKYLEKENQEQKVEPTTAPTATPTVKPTEEPKTTPKADDDKNIDTDLSMFKEGQIYCGRVTLELQRAGIDYVEVDCFDEGEVTFTVKKIDKKPSYNSLILFRVRSSGAVSLVKEFKQVNLDLDDFLLVDNVSGSLASFDGDYETIDLELDEYVLNGNTIRLDKLDFFLVEVELDKDDEYYFADARQVDVSNLKLDEEDRIYFDSDNKLCFVVRGIEVSE